MRNERRTVLDRYIASVSDEDVEQNAQVEAARLVLLQAEQQHATYARSLAKVDTLLPQVDEQGELARRRLLSLRNQLPAISGAVLMGEIAEAEERALLDQIAETERVARRCELGRPVVESRIYAARQRIAPLAQAVNDAQSRLEQAKDCVREELARSRM